MAMLSPSILRARVTHARRTPKKNSFAYGVDYVLLNEEQLAGGATPKLFSYGRRNLVSLHPSDHGPSDCGPDWARQIAKDAGLGEIAEVALLTHPRYWGYVFNPVSFWFLTAPDGALKAVIAEVHNTFGDRHWYLCRNADGGDITSDDWIEADKKFHVSPFFKIEGRYRFRFALEEERIALWIRYEDGHGGGLSTALIGDRHPFTDAELMGALIRRPMGAAKTTTLIHWQALKLFLKGLRYHQRPNPPQEHLTS